MCGKEIYRETNALLNGLLSEKKPVIAVHRSGWGGNVPPSSLLAIRTGLMLGGDMMELDVALDRDGRLWVFHDGNEMQSFREKRNIREIPSREVEALDFVNPIGERSGKHLSSFDDLLDAIGNDVIFNVDRCWGKLPEIDRVMMRHPEKIRQALMKTHAEDDSLEFFSTCPRKYMYMGVVSSMEEVRKVLSYGDAINLVGFELISENEDSDLFQDENIKLIHDAGLFTWANAISLGSAPRFRIFAGLDDDLALSRGPDASWGIMMDKEMDVIQTDWPSILRDYRDGRKND